MHKLCIEKRVASIASIASMANELDCLTSTPSAWVYETAPGLQTGSGYSESSTDDPPVPRFRFRGFRVSS